MKQINGTAFNIEADILGRITLKGKASSIAKTRYWLKQTQRICRLVTLL